MLEDKDVQKLVEVFATKEELRQTKEELLSTLATKEDMNKLMTSLDAYAKRAETIFQEVILLGNRMNRFERWAEKVAEKTGVRFEN